jgi:aldose sugar dehydrogenase
MALDPRQPGRLGSLSPSLRTLLLGTAFAALSAGGAAAEQTVATEHHSVRVQTIVQGLEHPWGLAFLPDGRFLVTERNAGRLRLGTPDGQLSEAVEGVPEVFRFEGTTPRSQGGLFDVALHPEFVENGFVYLSFSKPTERGSGVAVVRGRLAENGPNPRLEEVEEVFLMKEEDQDSSGLHFGGRMAFHPVDNALFLTIGERRNISRAQDENDQAGAIIRVLDDGSTPEDNPFAGEDGKDDKIYAKGIRNSQGLTFHPHTAELWATDHGPRGGDEINRIEAGGNYGWPFLTAGTDYSGAPIGVGTKMEGMTSAVHYFEETVAPSGLAFYTGDLFPEWQGDLLVGGLSGQALVRLRLDGQEVVAEEWMLEEVGRRIRDVKVADDGSVWLLTEHADGEVLRLTPAE